MYIIPRKPLLKTSLLLAGLSLATACSYIPGLNKVLPDRKNEYKKSQSLPDLEIPPDLTVGALNDSMTIPDEAPATLSSYANPPTARRAPTETGVTESEERWIAVTESREALWPKLAEFFRSREFPLAVDDQELGVLETGWSPPVEQEGLVTRYKYGVFAEPGANPGAAVLYLNQQRQTRPAAAEDWVNQDKDPRAEGRFAAELGAFLAPLSAGGAAAATQPGAAAERKELQVVDVGDGKLYLVIPDAFEQAWIRTETALRDAGMKVLGKDPDKGLYQFVYQPDEEGEKKGFLSRLAFWKGGGDDAVRQLSLTGVGDSTELIVLNEKGDWETTDEASRILVLLRNRYPRN